MTRSKGVAWTTLEEGARTISITNRRARGRVSRERSPRDKTQDAERVDAVPRRRESREQGCAGGGKSGGVPSRICGPHNPDVLKRERETEWRSRQNCGTESTIHTRERRRRRRKRRCWMGEGTGRRRWQQTPRRKRTVNAETRHSGQQKARLPGKHERKRRRGTHQATTDGARARCSRESTRRVVTRGAQPARARFHRGEMMWLRTVEVRLYKTSRVQRCCDLQDECDNSATTMRQTHTKGRSSGVCRRPRDGGA